MTPRRWVVALVALLVVLRIVAVVVLMHSGIEDQFSILGGDARRYEEIVTGQGHPYQDFDVEYPPVTLGELELIVVPHDPMATLWRLAAVQLVMEAVVAGLLAWAWNGRTAIIYLLLGTPMLLFPFPYVRIDLLSVALAVGGMALVRRRHGAAGGVALAVSMFAKLWPVALAPVLLVRRRWKGTAAFAAIGLVGAALWFAYSGTAGFEQVLTFRESKGWQIESLPGMVLHALDPGASHVEAGAWRTGAEMPGWSRPVLTLASLAVVAVSWLLAERAQRSAPGTAPGSDRVIDDAVYGWAPLAAVLGLLIFAPIISPQYLLWIMPFVAILAASGNRTIGWVGLALSVLSTFVLADIHALIEARLHALAPLFARNILLVVALVMSLQALARAARPSRADPEGRPAPVPIDASA